MDNDNKLRLIQAKTRRRLLFTLLTLILYFSFILNWTDTGAVLTRRLGDSHITGSLLMFAATIILLVLLELVFLLINLRIGAANGRRP